MWQVDAWTALASGRKEDGAIAKDSENKLDLIIFFVRLNSEGERDMRSPVVNWCR